MPERKKFGRKSVNLIFQAFYIYWTKRSPRTAFQISLSLLFHIFTHTHTCKYCWASWNCPLLPVFPQNSSFTRAIIKPKLTCCFIKTRPFLWAGCFCCGYRYMLHPLRISQENIFQMAVLSFAKQTGQYMHTKHITLDGSSAAPDADKLIEKKKMKFETTKLLIVNIFHRRIFDVFLHSFQFLFILFFWIKQTGRHWEDLHFREMLLALRARRAWSSWMQHFSRIGMHFISHLFLGTNWIDTTVGQLQKSNGV